MNEHQAKISKVLSSIGFDSLNSLQEETLEKSVTSKNVLILSQTGSGKTFAFLLPLFLNLDPEAKHIQALVLAPSRELALQIEDVWRSMKTNFKVLSCYGGHSNRKEKFNRSPCPTDWYTGSHLRSHFKRHN
jgi:superfamily II DNA/RNA helicase